MFNAFANNKAGKKSQRKPLQGCQTVVRYRAAISWLDKGERRHSHIWRDPGIEMADSRREVAENRGCPRWLSIKWDTASRNAIERAEISCPSQTCPSR